MKRLHLAAGFTILAAWTATVASGMATNNYSGLTLTTPIMAILAGYLFGDALFRKNRNGKDDDT